MKIKRYITIDVLEGSHLEEKEHGLESFCSPYIVDDSCFQPMSEAIKSLAKQPGVTSNEIAMTYDFPNGQDNGQRVPVGRRADVHDIAEISAEIMADTRKAADNLEAAKAAQSRNKRLAALQKSAAENAVKANNANNNSSSAE